MTQLELVFDRTNCREAVRAIMADGEWHTGYEVQQKLAAQGIFVMDSSATARIRDLRKKRYGGLDVEHKCIRKGHDVYRVR